MIFADIPLNPCVCYHSIIGSRDGVDIPKNEMTDGILTYEAAHLPGVPEKVITSTHSVHRHPDGVAEIIRILRSTR